MNTRDSPASKNTATTAIHKRRTNITAKSNIVQTTYFLGHNDEYTLQYTQSHVGSNILFRESQPKKNGIVSLNCRRCIHNRITIVRIENSKKICLRFGRKGCTNVYDNVYLLVVYTFHTKN